MVEEIYAGGGGKTLVQQGQRHGQRSAAFHTQTLMLSALAPRLIDAPVAVNVAQVSSKGCSHPGTGTDTKQQEWL